jgi:hypothetical protein
VILASPLSWTGASTRIWRHFAPRTLDVHGWTRAGREATLWSLLAAAVIGVAAFYALLALCGVLPLIVLVVVRAAGRAERKREIGRLRHAELMGPPA